LSKKFNSTSNLQNYEASTATKSCASKDSDKENRRKGQLLAESSDEETNKRKKSKEKSSEDSTSSKFDD
jgi:hypothetical protein